MAYIGQGIKQGTFKVLDTSGNTYNGSNTTFSLGTQVGSAAQLLVSHDGVIQKPGTDYTLASGGASITFSTAPASGASIFITEISGAVGGTVTPSDTSVTADKLNSALLTGHTDIGANIADADLFLTDDGAGGTLRKTAASRLKTYVGAGAGAFSIANLDIDGGTDIGADIADSDLFVTTDKLGADAVTEAKIADDAVESEHLNNNIISGQTELASAPDSTDELLISDGGTLKRIDVSLIGGTNTPYFEAVISSAQDVSDNTYTKIAMSVENLDSANAYDNSSNYRFTPQTAGKYYCYLHINGLAANAGNGNMREIGGSIYKNGSRYAETFHDHNDNDGRQGGVSCMAIITFNGSSDYIEAYGYVNTVAGGDGRIDHSGSPSARTRFGAFKIIE